MMLIVMMKKVKFGSETKKFMPKRMIHRKKMMERWVMGDKKKFFFLMSKKREKK